MRINRSFSSPNFDDAPLRPRVALIHYTACSLEKTLQLFCDPEFKASAHFVIAEDGEVFELVSAMNKPKIAWHAGKGILGNEAEERNLNPESLGIELVNLNGNVFHFHEQQLTALFKLARILSETYPNLNIPDAWWGHEHTAGYRGKVDPGWKFDWLRFYKSTFPDLEISPQIIDSRKPNLPEISLTALSEVLSFGNTSSIAVSKLIESLLHLS